MCALCHNPDGSTRPTWKHAPCKEARSAGDCSTQPCSHAGTVCRFSPPPPPLTPLSPMMAMQFVTLVSSDGHEFMISQKCALKSGTIKSMLNSGEGIFEEAETNEIVFREISSHILERVCIYFYYKERFANLSGEIPEFPIPLEIALELLMVSPSPASSLAPYPALCLWL